MFRWKSVIVCFPPHKYTGRVCKKHILFMFRLGHVCWQGRSAETSTDMFEILAPFDFLFGEM